MASHCLLSCLLSAALESLLLIGEWAVLERLLNQRGVGLIGEWRVGCKRDWLIE